MSTLYAHSATIFCLSGADSQQIEASFEIRRLPSGRLLACAFFIKTTAAFLSRVLGNSALLGVGEATTDCGESKDRFFADRRDIAARQKNAAPSVSLTVPLMPLLAPSLAQVS